MTVSLCNGTVTDMDDSSALLELPADHPGVSDPAYRARRAAIAAVGEAHRPGAPIADVEYSPEEDDVWHWAYLFSRALTIGGGTTEVLSNIIAEQLLGLPREPRPPGGTA